MPEVRDKMRQFVLKTEKLTADQMHKMLSDNGICINKYAEEYISHPRFFPLGSETITVTVASLQEIGFENDATLDEIIQHIQGIGLKPCRPCTGLFLRLSWIDQPQSRNSILSGTHSAPDQAVTVLSELLEQSDDFPKGLYLRNVDGNLWLRGYVCDRSYRFPKESLFAFEQI